MADCMNLPKTPIEFLKLYEFKDDKEIYTNGSMLIPTFRVYQMIERYFSYAQTSDVQEVKHGEWINLKNERRCSLCGFYYFTNGKGFNSCPECGAKMEK